MPVTTSRNRIDWRSARDSIDLRDVLRRELGDPPGRSGSRGRDWWRCPFHDDGNPSFTIAKDGQHWRCFGCGASGDAVELVKRLHNVGFPEAVAILTGEAPRSARVARPAPRPATKPEAPGPSRSDLTPEAAAELVADAARRLWLPEGAAALAYLTGRGLTRETIRAAGLGWLPEGNRAVPWRSAGITIPWFDGGRVVLVKVRPGDAWRDTLPPDRPRPPKYIDLRFRHPEAPPRLYPSPEVIRRGVPVVVVEGEFDALLLAQEIGDLAAVVTLGAASMGRNRDGIDPDIVASLGRSPRWWLATDADEAGDKAAALWEAYPRAKRFRPPDGAKDWSDMHAGGSNRIRYYWLPVLGWQPPTWEELESQRWGPALAGDPEAPPEGGPAMDPYAIAEREAIRAADGLP